MRSPAQFHCKTTKPFSATQVILFSCKNIHFGFYQELILMTHAVSLYERPETLPQVMEDIDNNYSDHDFEGSAYVDDGQLLFDKMKY